MNWLAFSFIASIFWALVVLIDKVLVEKYFRKAETFVALDGLFGVIPLGFFLLQSGGLEIASFSVQFLAILSGILTSGYYFLYFKALKIGNAATVATISQTIPVFSVMIGYFYFNERFTFWTYLGIVFAIIAAIIAASGISGASRDQTEKNSKLPLKLFTLLIPGSLLMGIVYGLEKYGLGIVDVNEFYALQRLGSLILSLIIFTYKPIQEDIRNTLLPRHKFEIHRAIPMLGIAIESVINLAGIYVILLAYSTGPISIVATIASTQPIFVALFGIPLNYYLKYSIEQRLTRVEWKKRILSFALILISVYLISQ